MTTRDSSVGGGTASSSVSSDSTITGIRQETRPTSTRGTTRSDEERLSSAGYPHPQHWNAFESYGRDIGDIINNVENVDGTRTIKTHGTPPPAYATLSPHVASGSGGDYTYSATSTHTHPEFGPTPLTAQHPLLAVPYQAYEYIGSPGAPDRRARWRFAGGLFWAVVVLGVVGGLGVLGAVGETGRGQ